MCFLLLVKIPVVVYLFPLSQYSEYYQAVGALGRANINYRTRRTDHNFVVVSDLETSSYVTMNEILIRRRDLGSLAGIYVYRSLFDVFFET